MLIGGIIYKSVMKTIFPILALIVAASFEVLAGDNQPTVNPVQTSIPLPIGKSISGLWINTNVVSGIMTNPTTNRAGILLPPTGLHVQKG
jgi:hypothetical protein